MLRRVAFSVATAALLLGILPQVAAHGGEDMNMSAHDVSQAEPGQHNQPSSYWSHSEHAVLMYWHIALEIMAWVVILPVGE